MAAGAWSRAAEAQTEAKDLEAEEETDTRAGARVKQRAASCCINILVKQLSKLRPQSRVLKATSCWYTIGSQGLLTSKSSSADDDDVSHDA